MNQQNQNQNKKPHDSFSHFQKKEVAPPIKESFFEKLGDQLRQRGDKKKAKQKAELALLAMSFLAARKKWILIGGGALLFLILVAVVAPNIPLQLQRSAGFSALENGDYQGAYEELNAYLIARPNDHQAAYYAAQAAIRIGDSNYAASLLNNLYTGNVLAEPDIPYYYALVNIASPDNALQALDALLSKNPDHVGARFLRGWLLRDVDGAVRRAREDFLHVDELMRNSEESFPDILFLHGYLVKSGAFSVNFSVNLSPQPRPSVLSKSFGFDTGLGGYLIRYRLSTGNDFMGADLPPPAIAALYFSYMLMSHGETEEAEAELNGAENQNPDSFAVRQAFAFLRIRENDYAAAAEAFTALVRDAPDDADTLNNAAITRVLNEWSEDSVATAIRLHNDVLLVDPLDIVALNNGAYLHITQGDYMAADRLLSEVSADATPQTNLNLGLIKLWRNDPDGAVDLFSTISEQDISNIGRYVTNVYVRQRDFDKAIKAYRLYEEKNPDEIDLVMGRVKILIESGDLQLAYQVLIELAEQHPNHAETHYRLAGVALNLGDNAVFEHGKATLLEVAGESSHYYQSLRAQEFSHNGDLAAAAVAAAMAMADASDTQSLHDYAVQWAQFLVESDGATVAETLRPMLDDYYDEEIVALLGYALAESDPARAIELIDLLQSNNNLSFVSQRYAGGALAKIGDYRDALLLLERARQWMPTHVPLLEALQDVRVNSGDAEAATQLGEIIDYLRDVATGKDVYAEVTYEIYVPQKGSAIGIKIRGAVTDPNAVQLSDAVLAEYDAALKKETNALERARLFYSRATFLAYLKRFADSAKNFQQALVAGLLPKEEQTKALLFYTEVLSQQERYAEIAQIAEQLLTLDESLLYRRIYASSFSDSGNLERAVSEYVTLLGRYPAALDAYYDLAQLQNATERTEEAEETLKRLLRIAPNYALAYKLLADIYNQQGEREKVQEYNDVYVFLTSGG